MNASSSLPFATRALASIGWALVCFVGSTVMMALSHLGANVMLGSPRRAGMAEAQSAGLQAVVALVVVLVALLVLAYAVPALKAAALRVSLLCGALMLTGLPCAMLALAFTTWMDGADFRHWSGPSGLIAFVLWLRVMTEGWRGVLIAWR